MKKIKLLFYFYPFISFCFSQELNKENKREYRKKRIFIESYGSTSGRLSQWSISSTTTTKWRPRINNKVIKESLFYKLAKEEDYYKKAKFNEDLFFWTGISGVALSLIGSGLFLAGYFDYKNKENKYFNSLPNEVHSQEELDNIPPPNYDYSDTLMIIGSLTLIGGVLAILPAAYVFFFVDKLVDIQTANELAMEYNQELQLQIGILQKF